MTGSSTLTPKQRELLLTRIGVLCRSEYEYAAHLRLGRQAGFTDADVARVLEGRDSSPGEPLETALLRATGELFEDDVVSPPPGRPLPSPLTRDSCSTCSLPSEAIDRPRC